MKLSFINNYFRLTDDIMKSRSHRVNRIQIRILKNNKYCLNWLQSFKFQVAAMITYHIKMKITELVIRCHSIDSSSFPTCENESGSLFTGEILISLELDGVVRLQSHFNPFLSGINSKCYL